MPSQAHTANPHPTHNDALRREGSTRRSLRSMRCQSVVITEKEKTLLIKQTDKKMTAQEGKVAASKGFVRSMCKFYSDIIGGDRSEKKKSLLDRSASFSAVKEGVSSLESISEKGASDQCLSSPVSSRSGSFRLNRSRSWRGSRLETYNETDTPKRNSPTGQSVRSQDSGFSDSGEHIHPDIDGSYESQSSSATSGAEEDNHKSFVTKISIDDAQCGKQANQDNFLQRVPISETYQVNNRTGGTPVARQKVTGSLDNIVSLKEGLKINLGTEPRSLFNQGCDANVEHFHSTTNNNQQNVGLLLRTKPRSETQSVLSVGPLSENDNPLSPSTAACPRFSTPVRASFRRRPQTMICNMEEVQTPVNKRESRTKLKEIKSRRRWSTNIDQDQSKMSPLSVNTSSSQMRSSSSQYTRNNLNGEACYEFRNKEERNSHLSPSMTALSLISPVESYHSISDKIISPLKTTSHDTPPHMGGQSFNVDGTGTRLMIESFINNSAVAGRSVNTIFPNESILAGLECDTIIEHDCSTAVTGGVTRQVSGPGQDHGPSVVINNTSLSNR